MLVQIEADGDQPAERVIADDLVTDCMERWNIAHYHKLGFCKGKDQKGRSQHLLFDLQVPVILGAHVTTGVVQAACTHCTWSWC